MKTHSTADQVRFAQLNSAELRSNFLIETLFRPNTVELVYTDVDRAVVGSAVPVGQKLVLESSAELRSAYFAERRELGVFNIGGSGAITVDGIRHGLANRDLLYIGRGSQRIEFESESASAPAKYFLVSYPAHASHPTRRVRQAEAETLKLGNGRDANQRTVHKYVHPAGAASGQLLMGFTQLQEGSVWNTMPSHTHPRRSEVYLYFDVDTDACVFHFMGTPTETRHLVVANQQAVLSPSWSIHSGGGTRHYAFVWAMGGENQEFSDMDPLKLSELR